MAIEAIINKEQDAERDVSIPPLQSGDRLTRHEFERRYEAMLTVNKAELIEGVVYMPSPVIVDHSEAQGYIMGWLAAHCAATPGVKLNDNATVRLDLDNEVQPDALAVVRINGAEFTLKGTTFGCL